MAATAPIGVQRSSGCEHVKLTTPLPTRTWSRTAPARTASVVSPSSTVALASGHAGADAGSVAPCEIASEKAAATRPTLAASTAGWLDTGPGAVETAMLVASSSAESSSAASSPTDDCSGKGAASGGSIRATRARRARWLAPESGLRCPPSSGAQREPSPVGVGAASADDASERAARRERVEGRRTSIWGERDGGEVAAGQ